MWLDEPQPCASAGSLDHLTGTVGAEGITCSFADEGGWMSARTVETTYAHLAGGPALEAALNEIGGEQA